MRNNEHQTRYCKTKRRQVQTWKRVQMGNVSKVRYNRKDGAYAKHDRVLGKEGRRISEFLKNSKRPKKCEDVIVNDLDPEPEAVI